MNYNLYQFVSRHIKYKNNKTLLTEVCLHAHWLPPDSSLRSGRVQRRRHNQRRLPNEGLCSLPTNNMLIFFKQLSKRQICKRLLLFSVNIIHVVLLFQILIVQLAYIVIILLCYMRYISILSLYNSLYNLLFVDGNIKSFHC